MGGGLEIKLKYVYFFLSLGPTFTRRNTAETYGEDDVAEEEASIKGERQRAPILELSKIVDVFLGFWVLEFLVGAGDEEGEAQTKLRRDGEDSGARGNKDGVVADCATDDGVWGGEGRGLGSMGQ
ncbi:BnaC09g22430D [Brassica napus]|uniref:BnaC09g22430D protein n=1 Tax=Brassica napus TaxID=3708 RepID=A0A078I3U4_BRANA|nr:BnaC09g22430D [Brassica napus]